MNLGLKTLVVLLTSLFVISNVVARGASASVRPMATIPTENTAAPPVPKRYDIPAPTIPGKTCFDLQEFQGRLTFLPSDALIRRHTVAVSTDENNLDGSKPRPHFLSVLALSLFKFEEMSPFVYENIDLKIEQTDCDLVRITELLKVPWTMPLPSQPQQV